MSHLQAEGRRNNPEKGKMMKQSHALCVRSCYAFVLIHLYACAYIPIIAIVKISYVLSLQEKHNASGYSENLFG